MFNPILKGVYTPNSFFKVFEVDSKTSGARGPHPPPQFLALFEFELLLQHFHKETQ